MSAADPVIISNHIISGTVGLSMSLAVFFHYTILGFYFYDQWLGNASDDKKMFTKNMEK